MGGNKRSSNKKEPRRGSGIAELERLRMLSQQQMAPVNPPPPLDAPSFNGVLSLQNMQKDPTLQLMGLSEYEKTNISNGDSQPNNTARWEHATAILENQSSAQTSIIGPFLNLHDSQGINSEKHRSGSADSSSWNTQEPDLELRLSQEPDLELRLSLGPATRKCSDSPKK